MSLTWKTVHRLWLGVAILGAALLIHLAIYLSLPERGESLSFKLLAAGLGCFALALMGFAVWLTPPRLERIRRLVSPWEWLYLVSGFVLLVFFGLNLRPEWFYAHAALVLAAVFSLGYWSFFDANVIASPWGRCRIGFVIVAVILVTLLRLYGLTTSPEPEIVDEPWVLGWAISYLKVGHPVNWIMLGIDGDPAYYLPRYAQAMAAWMRLIGTGYWEARVFSFLVAMAVIPFMALAAKNLYDRPTAFFTAGILFTSNVLLFGARVRHDIGLALAMAISLWLYSEARKRNRPVLHLLAGVFMGWGLFSHYHATLFGLVMLIGLYGPQYLRQLDSGRYWPETDVWLYGIGGLLSGASVAAIQILPDVNTFIMRLEARNPRNPGEFINAVFGHIGNVPYHSQFQAVLIGLGFLSSLRRREYLPVIIIILGHLALGYLALVAFKHYVIPLAPFYALVTARLFRAGVERTSTIVTRGMVVTFAAFLAVSLGTSLHSPVQHLINREPLRLPAPPVVDWIKQNLQPDETILSDNYYFLWLYDYRFASILIPEHLPKAERERYQQNPESLWEEVSIKVIIYDPALPTHDRFEHLFAEGFLKTGGFHEAAQFGDVVVYRHR
ncbi:MAG: glycosyltransferase family 39 protein [Chloroflexi bacterium]|nr:glycosyltransferase family 39 protein [Chloroflexota bacterium]